MIQNVKEDSRLAELTGWLENCPASLALRPLELAAASADASFRRYFRLPGACDRTFIVMDAPPPCENIRPFLHVCSLMQAAGLNVPEVFASDADRGFILMSDLGTQTYLDVINEGNVSELMEGAVQSLVLWQRASRPGVLPEYDRTLLSRELSLFPEWYILRHRGWKLSWKECSVLEKTFGKILDHNLAEARVYVHRDFMPRNLMVGGKMPGVIDFQDAVYGPVSYDIASLMRDAFVSWKESRVIDVTVRYWELARRSGIPVPADFGVFWRDVEWMGLQRHLKVAGIFSRINYRDGKPKYLADTPRFIGYIRRTAARYDELKPLNWLLDRFEEEKSGQACTF